jgi:hypothetical protein
VRGQNTEGTYGGVSLVRRFTTGNFPPATPVPFFPAHGDSDVSRTPTFKWLASPGALDYRAQLSLDNLFTQIIADDSTIPGPIHTPDVLLESFRTYYWRVRARGTAGSSSYCVIQRFTTGNEIVAVPPGTGSEVPEEFVLHQNYPNPFNPSTTLAYDVTVPAMVTIRIYNVLGQDVQTLAAGEHPAGTYSVVWNGRDRNDTPMPSGMYVVRMTASSPVLQRSFSSTRKMMLMK